MAQHLLGSSESLVADGITALDMHKKAMSLTCGEGFMGHDSLSTEYGSVGLRRAVSHHFTISRKASHLKSSTVSTPPHRTKILAHS